MATSRHVRPTTTTRCPRVVVSLTARTPAHRQAQANLHATHLLRVLQTYLDELPDELAQRTRRKIAEGLTLSDDHYPGA
jgi:hypothetical protein